MPRVHRLHSLAAGGPEGRALAVAQLAALLATHGNVRATAKFLGVTEKTVHGWLTRWGMRRPKK